MLNISDLTAEQQRGVDRLYDCDQTLFIGSMGLGKSVITLTAIAELVDDGFLSHVLIVSPLKVCQTVWVQEAAKWAQCAGLTVAVAIGAPAKREAALRERANVTVINFENLPWLFKNSKKYHGAFDGLVVDELTKLKASGGKIFKSLRPRLADFKWRVGLTGTPVSEDFEALYAMALVIDCGAALGTRSDAFKRKYFWQVDYAGYDWALHDWAAAAILDAVDSIVFNAADYTGDLPAISYRVHEIDMPLELRDQYEELRKTCILELAGDDEVEAGSAAVLSGKLQQVASGFVYDEFGDTVRLSEYRLEALDCVINDASGCVVVCYWFKSDLEALCERYPNAVALGVGDVAANCAAWNRGEIPILLLHPRSAGHGISLQIGGCELVWYTPTWSRDLWLQTNARVWRRGQKSPVQITSIVATGTVDELVVARVEDKAEFGEMWDAHFS